MRSYPAVIEKCPETGIYVGYVPGFPGAHSQGEPSMSCTRIFVKW